MKKRSKGITIIEILVVLLLASISLFIILQGITGINTAVIRQTEFLNCLSIAKNYIDLYSYYQRGSIGPRKINTTFNIGSNRYDINILVEDFGNHTNNLNLRRLTITVSSPRQRNLRTTLITLI
ncbi:MAG: hypothetical protein NZM44_07055 [Candidatus Calescibacterium sp.]|nr:hypothetical protein [Candidatus Calescibacterium sp.]